MTALSGCLNNVTSFLFPFLYFSTSVLVFLKDHFLGHLWWPRVWDSTLPVQGAWVQSLIRNLDPKEGFAWVSRMGQWLRNCPAMHETLVQFLVWEDPTCHEQLRPGTTATKPAPWSPWAATPEAHVPLSPCSTTRAATAKRSPHITARE